jgi:hypothetical protein
MTVSLLQKSTTSSSSLTYLDEESVIDLAEEDPESFCFCGDEEVFTGDVCFCFSRKICFFTGDFCSSNSNLGVNASY